MWVKLIYGFIETLVVLLFVLQICNIKIPVTRLIFLTSCKVLVILAVRALYAHNIYIIISNSIFFDLLFIWLFTGVLNFRVIIASTTAYLLIVFIEQPITLFFFNYFHDLDYRIAWVLTGLPHILVLAAIIFLIRKAAFLNAQN